MSESTEHDGDPSGCLAGIVLLIAVLMACEQEVTQRAVAIAPEQAGRVETPRSDAVSARSRAEAMRREPLDANADANGARVLVVAHRRDWRNTQDCQRTVA